MNYDLLPKDWPHLHKLKSRAGVRMDSSAAFGIVVVGEIMNGGTRMQPNLNYHTSIKKTVDFECAGEEIRSWIGDNIRRQGVNDYSIIEQDLIEFLLGIRSDVRLKNCEDGEMSVVPPKEFLPRQTKDMAREIF